jgi:hypothetical protein
MNERTTKVKGAKSVTLKQTFNCGNKKNDKNKYVYHRYGPSNQQATIAAFERVLDMKQRELDLERRACAVRVAEFEYLLKMIPAVHPRRPVTANYQETQEVNGRERPNRGENPNRQQPPTVHPRRPVTANNQETRSDIWNSEINNHNEQQNRVGTPPKRIPKKTEKGLQYNRERAGRK